MIDKQIKKSLLPARLQCDQSLEFYICGDLVFDDAIRPQGGALFLALAGGAS